VVGIEHPDIGAADARRGDLWIGRAVLAAVRGGDERALATGAREHDVARLVADQQRALDVPAWPSSSSVITLTESDR